MPQHLFPASSASVTVAAGCLLAALACRDASEPSEAPAAAVTSARLFRDIVFVSTRDGNREIYSMDSDGNQETNLSNHPADESDPSWSPDAKTIVFVRAVTGGAEIWLMDAGGANQRRVSLAVRGTPPYAASPRWSPDGSRIAFLRSTSSGAAGDLYTAGIRWRGRPGAIRSGA
jgi:dipeptidyl aminopeptidase/acylaminoacyl peptidase